MADITDLTGYTWEANSTLYFSYFQTLNFNLNFNSNNTDYSLFKIEWDDTDVFKNTLYYDTIAIYDDINNVWKEDSFKTIKINGGTDVNNVFLIEFLQNNGTLSKAATGSIKIGSESVDKIYLGDTTINRLYLGDTLVYKTN